MSDSQSDGRADVRPSAPDHGDAAAGASVIAAVLGGAVRLPRSILSETFPAGTDQVANARRLARQALPGHPQHDQVVLLVSELVTNVVLHSSGARWFTLMIAETEGRDVWIAVTDDGRGDDIPHLCAGAPTDTGGRGLRIVDRLATRWGLTRARHQCGVWCCVTPPYDDCLVEPKPPLPGAVRWCG